MGSAHKRGAYAVVVALCLFGVSARSVADDAISRGIQLRKEGRDQEALPFFQRAVREQGAPRAFGQLGTCEQALGLWVEAEAHITEALAHPKDPWVQKNESPLKAAREHVQARLGSIEVWGKPAGASVSIDGDSVGVLPMAKPARAVVGQRKLAVDAPGYQPERRTIEVSPGELVRERVVLQAATVAEQPKSTVTPADEPMAAPSHISDPMNVHPPDPTRLAGAAAAAPGESTRWKTWTGVGLLVGAAGLLAWGVVWVAIDGNQQSCNPSGPSDLTCRKYDTGSKGWMLMGVGAVAAAGGGLLLYLGAHGERSDLAVRISPTGAQFLGHF